MTVSDGSSEKRDGLSSSKTTTTGTLTLTYEEIRESLLSDPEVALELKFLYHPHRTRHSRVHTLHHLLNGDGGARCL